MREAQFAELSVIGMRGCENFSSQVDYYLKEWSRHGEDKTFLVKAECPRFGTGEGKGLLHESLRGHDVYIISDCFNHGVTYKMYGKTVPMSPDEHFADLKRVIAAIGGKRAASPSSCRSFMRAASTEDPAVNPWTVR